MGVDTRTATFQIPRLLASPVKCAECANRLCAGVLEILGVEGAECDARAMTMTIAYDVAVLTAEELERRLQDVGTGLSGRVEHAVYRVSGLD